MLFILWEKGLIRKIVPENFSQYFSLFFVQAPVHYDVFECLSITLPKLDIHNAFTIFSIEDLLKQFVAPETVNGVHCDNCSTNDSKNVFVKQLSLGKVIAWFWQCK